jgi:hypothetical protein
MAWMKTLEYQDEVRAQALNHHGVKGSLHSPLKIIKIENMRGNAGEVERYGTSATRFNKDKNLL